MVSGALLIFGLAAPAQMPGEARPSRTIAAEDDLVEIPDDLIMPPVPEDGLPDLRVGSRREVRPPSPVSQLSRCADADAAVESACEQINSLRAYSGIGPLRLDPLLNRMAKQYAQTLYSYANGRCSKGTLSHELDGPFYLRIQRGGVANRAAAENIACGSDALGTVRMWQTSPGHAENMFNSTYKREGLAHYGSFWVEILTN